MSARRLAEALRGEVGGRCPDGCDTTRALFPGAIERELAGEPPDADLYARLDCCPACAAEYIAALDLAYRLESEPVHAVDAPPLDPPGVLRYRQPEPGAGLRRVAEDPPDDGRPTTDDRRLTTDD